MIKALFTPKDLADAIGVSESSMRRWIDGGRLKITRTAGGHRRIEHAEAMRFVRESAAPLVRPEVLGLGEIATLPKSKAGDEQQLFDALIAGDRRLVRGLAVSWHLSGRSLASIFDGPLRWALVKLGELWLRERCGLLAEHCATDICIDLIHHLRSRLPRAEMDAALAIGLTPSDEWHSLPSQMAAAVARECGLRDTNYGANAPIDLLLHEATRRGAKLVWLSVTMKPRRELRMQVQRLAGELAKSETALVVGGQHAQSFGKHPNLHILGSMSEFAAFLEGMRNGHRS